MLALEERAVGSRLNTSRDRQRRLESLKEEADNRKTDCLTTHRRLYTAMSFRTTTFEIDFCNKVRKHIQVFSQLSIYCELFIENPSLDQSIIQPLYDLAMAFYEYREANTIDYHTRLPGGTNVAEVDLNRYHSELDVINSLQLNEHRSRLYNRLMFQYEWLIVLQLYVGRMTRTEAGEKCSSILADVLTKSRQLLQDAA